MTDEPAMVQLEFTIPDGAIPGQQLQVASATGQELLVVVPPGAQPGQTLRVEVPALRETNPLQNPQQQQQQQQQQQDGATTGGVEQAGVVVVSVVGFFGVVGSMAMLHHLETPGQGFTRPWRCCQSAALAAVLVCTGRSLDLVTAGSASWAPLDCSPLLPKCSGDTIYHQVLNNDTAALGYL